MDALGAIFSIAGASAWIRAVMLVNPLTYSTALLRQMLTPGVSDGSPEVATSLIVTVAFGIVLLAASAALASQKSSSIAA